MASIITTILLSQITDANRLLLQAFPNPSQPTCCNPAEKPSIFQCFEGYACCPDGIWSCSIGDGKTYPCGGGHLTFGIDTFGNECPISIAEPTPISPINTCYPNDPNCNAFYDGCNSCTCLPNGHTVCTMRACLFHDPHSFCTSCKDGFMTSPMTNKCEASTGCGGIPHCKSYKPDPCNTCTCGDPINNPDLAMCTLAFCGPPHLFENQCTVCMDGFTFDFNGNCVESLPIDPIPCICNEMYAPVCCGDGQTYSNMCTAECGGLMDCTVGACTPTTAIPIEISPLPGLCKYLPMCYGDPCARYIYAGNGMLCEGFPGAQCRGKVDCSGCYAQWVDVNGNEIECVAPEPQPEMVKVECKTDSACGNGFGCRQDLECGFGFCEKVCLDMNGLCTVDITDCGVGYLCVSSGFCVKYQEI